MYKVVELYLHPFLTSTFDGGEWSASRSGPFIPDTNRTGCFVDPRTDVDVWKK
jgi:hypothetical protein